MAGRPIWQLVNNLGAVLGLAGAAMAVSHLINLATAAVAARATARQHLAFPELRYLQVVERTAAVEPNIVVLDEVVTLLKVAAPKCVGDAVLGPLRSALDDFLETVPLQHLPQQAPPVPDFTNLGQVPSGVADPSALQRAFAQEGDRRRRLLALLREAGWDWEAVEG